MKNPESFIGIDLGWTTGATGCAVVDHTGRLLDSAQVQTDDEIVAFVRGVAGPIAVAAVDAPLIVPNETGQRVPERLVAQAFGGFGASPHTSNRRKFDGEQPRGMRIAERCGWSVDPGVVVGRGATVCIEVYPHPALVGLFGLDYRVDYKKGSTARRQPGFLQLVDLLESVPELGLAENSRWSAVRDIAANPRPGGLDRVEDEVDAVVCAHLAWLWRHGRDRLHVYGSLADGYIVAPPPPTHRARRPIERRPWRAARPRARHERDVVGRPASYATVGEHPWKHAVRVALSGCTLPAECRAEIDVEFRLATDQVGRNEPDLDNLVKTTIDALDGVLGARAGTGERLEADDVRVDRIVAAKRLAGLHEPPGARIIVSEMAAEHPDHQA